MLYNQWVIMGSGVFLILFVHVDDLRAIKELADLGVDSAILGKSLYARAFTLEEALEVAR